jgi:hypothetical protein
MQQFCTFRGAPLSHTSLIASGMPGRANVEQALEIAPRTLEDRE